MRRGWRNNDNEVRLNNYFKYELDSQIRDLKAKGYVLINRGEHPNENGFWARMVIPERA